MLGEFDSLRGLEDRMGDCQRCALASTRTTLVFGVGDPGARLMFVGEAPGRNEDLRGEPFVGAAGRLLDELLASIGVERSDVYIANILKCRPPGNRNPSAQEIETCAPFLREQIKLVAPEVVVTMGNFATRYILGTTDGITSVRGRAQQQADLKVFPIFHPAAALYDVTKRDVLLADFRVLGEIIGSVPGQRTSGTDVDPPPCQPSLFEE